MGRRMSSGGARGALRADRTPGEARARLIELARVYRDGTLGAPSPFFPTPESAPLALARVGEGPLGTITYDATWPSAYQPFHPDARAVVGAVRENHTCHARLWTSQHGRPTIVLIHGWGQGNHRMSALAFDLPYWLRHGFDVAAFTLPYHGARAPGPSGALFPSGNPLRTNEAFGQAIHDARALAIALRARGASAVGALGMSLGGYTTALWASVAGLAERDAGGLDFAVALIPAVSFANLMWRHGEDHPTRRRAVQAGIDEALLADAFAVHAPTTRPARLPPERLAVIAGRGDRITPPDHAEALAAHWGVEVGWFDGGHLAQLGRGDAIRVARRKLGALGFPHQTYRAP